MIKFHVLFILFITVNEGPLSSESFMMTMRSGKRVLSREPSPEGSVTSVGSSIGT